MFEAPILIVAAFLAGALNAVAGGGSFITFPALVYAGVPPIAANATSTVAVSPGYLGGALGFFSDLHAMNRRETIVMIALGLLGGVLGSALLLVTPGAVFDAVVPALLLFATLLFSFGDRLTAWIGGRNGAAKPPRHFSILAVSVYGGYFNGGLGIILLALFSALGMRNLHLMNGLKNLLSLVLSACSIAIFSAGGLIHWPQALMMAVFAMLGGYGGAFLSKRLPVGLVRAFIVAVGFVMTAVFLVRTLTL